MLTNWSKVGHFGAQNTSFELISITSDSSIRTRVFSFNLDDCLLQIFPRHITVRGRIRDGQWADAAAKHSFRCNKELPIFADVFRNGLLVFKITAVTASRYSNYKSKILYNFNSSILYLFSMINPLWTELFFSSFFGT